MSDPNPVERLAAGLAAAGLEDFRVAVVAGSGLGGLDARLEDARRVPFEDVDGMPSGSVPGHRGSFAIGELGGVRTLVQQGRVHLYEGATPQEAARSVRAFARLGCGVLVLTNAAGGLVPDWEYPGLMRVTDHLNLQSRSPLTADETALGNPWDAELGECLDGHGVDFGLRSGVYAGLLGPSYETPAEVGLLARLGAHAVGMSTVGEALAGDASGMRVVGVSCLTNPGAGIAPQALSHDEVVRAGGELSARLGELIARALPDFERIACA